MLRCLLLLSCLCGVARASDLFVPGDAATIQGAIALAQAGDTIHVGPGTWPGAVDFLGKDLRVLGTAGLAETTIDGGPAEYAVKLGAHGGDARLSGFTVIGGVAGRVQLVAGIASVRQCRVSGAGAPGGVGILSATAGSKLVADCEIRDNLGGGVRGSFFPGGGLTVDRCLVEGNGSAAVVQGGGLFGAGVVARDCVVRGNVAAVGGGAALLVSQQGCLFVGNTATVRAGGYYGEGTVPTLDVVVEDSAWIGNHAPLYGGVQLATASFGESGPHILRRCILAGNTDEAGDVGLYSKVSNFSAGPLFTRLEQCTVQGNGIVAVISGGGVLEVAGSIVRGTPTPFTSAIVAVNHSDVEGLWPGIGNFDSDPRFVDEAHDVYALTPSSPCVDAAGPDLPLDPDGSAADVGALALGPFADAHQASFGSLGLPALSGTGSLQGGTSVALSVVRAQPLASATLLLGLPGVFAPFKGGVLVPAPLFVFAGLPVAGDGALTLAGTWPSGLPSGTVAWAQFWIADGAAVSGYAASNGLGFVAP